MVVLNKFSVEKIEEIYSEPIFFDNAFICNFTLNKMFLDLWFDVFCLLIQFGVFNNFSKRKSQACKSKIENLIIYPIDTWFSKCIIISFANKSSLFSCSMIIFAYGFFPIVCVCVTAAYFLVQIRKCIFVQTRPTNERALTCQIPVRTK